MKERSCPSETKSSKCDAGDPHRGHRVPVRSAVGGRLALARAANLATARPKLNPAQSFRSDRWRQGPTFRRGDCGRIPDLFPRSCEPVCNLCHPCRAATLTRSAAKRCGSNDYLLLRSEVPWIPKSFNRSRSSRSAGSSPRPVRSQAAGLYPYFNPISESEDTVVVIDGQKRIMLGSNNYLGLTHHPKVLEAASRALHRYGSGCTGSRFLNGTLDLHEQLESALAEFLGKEACLVFSTGYSANLGLISGLVGRGETCLPRQAGPRVDRGRRQALLRRDRAVQPRRPRQPGAAARAQGLERQRLHDRGGRRVLDGGQHRRRPRPDAGGPEVRRGPGPRRRPRPRRAGPERRRHRGPLRHDRRGGHHRRHLLQVARLHRRLRGGLGERDPLSQAPQPAAHLHRLAAAGQHRRRARRARGAPARARAP